MYDTRPEIPNSFQMNQLNNQKKEIVHAAVTKVKFSIFIIIISHCRGQWLATMAATPWFGGSNPSDDIEL